MKAGYRIAEDADGVRNMPVTMQVTMTVSEWKRLRDDLQSDLSFNRPANSAAQWAMLVDRFVNNLCKKLYGEVEMGAYFERDIKQELEETK